MTEADFPAFAEIMHRASELTTVPNGKDVERVTLALFQA